LILRSELIAKRSFEEKPGNAGLFLFGTLKNCVVLRGRSVFAFAASLKTIHAPFGRAQIAQARRAGNPCSLRLI
jgi:hypothetical protein